MMTLFGIIAIVLTVAIIFGRKAAQRLVKVGLIVAGALLALVLLLAIGAVAWFYFTETLPAQKRMANVEHVMAMLPTGVPESDRAIMKQELVNYFSGKYDKEHVPDLETIEIFLRKNSPEPVRH